MKLKKTVTEKVIAANKANGKKGTGPDDTSTTRNNAGKHFLLAQKIIFRDEADKKEFETLREELCQHHNPVGPSELTIVEELAVEIWRWRDLYGWESLEVCKYKAASSAVLKAIGQTGDGLEHKLEQAINQGWQAQELVCRTASRGRDEDGLGEMTDITGHIIVEAKLTNSLDLILRYGAAIRRDYYRALDKLIALQRARIELDQLQPYEGEEADDEEQ